MEGKLEEGRQWVLRLLTRRLVNLTPEHIQRVRALDLTRIEALAEALLDFSTVQDFQQWLAGNSWFSS